jgi:hypothetical protein
VAAVTTRSVTIRVVVVVLAAVVAVITVLHKWNFCPANLRTT